MLTRKQKETEDVLSQEKYLKSKLQEEQTNLLGEKSNLNGEWLNWVRPLTIDQRPTCSQRLVRTNLLYPSSISMVYSIIYLFKVDNILVSPTHPSISIPFLPLSQSPSSASLYTNTLPLLLLPQSARPIVRHSAALGTRARAESRYGSATVGDNDATLSVRRQGKNAWNGNVRPQKTAWYGKVCATISDNDANLCQETREK